MKIIVSHLTKLGPGMVGIAGVDQATRRHVRPLTNRPLRLSHVAGHGGPFGIGRIVDLGPTRGRGAPPEVEDQLFREHQLRAAGAMRAAAFWDLLTKLSQPGLRRIFGGELERVGSTCALPIHRGAASLGCLAPSRASDLAIERRETERGVRETLRLTVGLSDLELRLPVTDLRFSSYDASGPRWIFDSYLVDSVNRRVEDRVPVLLTVGLSRPFQRSADDVPRHWLQINNIHLADDPLWAGTLALADSRASAEL